MVVGRLVSDGRYDNISQRHRKPNILIIVADDYGYSDTSTNPYCSKEVSTPNIDRIAASGVICSNGYVSGHISSATRAGLMTGMYQQRFGLYTAGEAGSGLDMQARIFPQYLKEAGYVCGQFGKWHLGPTPEWSPYKRGFDYQFGFLGRGAHDYFKLNDPKDPIYRNDQEIEEKGYLTFRLADEVSEFIERNAKNRFSHTSLSMRYIRRCRLPKRKSHVSIPRIPRAIPCWPWSSVWMMP